LIADEPTSSLDDENADNVLKILTQQAAENHASLVIATHDKRVKDKLNKEYLL
ncbi:MAG: ABC transporter ATP-binding protein, partial [Pedobacter sp.]